MPIIDLKVFSQSEVEKITPVPNTGMSGKGYRTGQEDGK